MRRGLRALCLGHYGEVETRVSTHASCTAVMLRRGFQTLRFGIAVMLRRDFQALRLDAALVVIISLASGV